MWPVIYTDKLPAGVAGRARGPIILVRPEYRGDEGLYRHELEHVYQYLILGLTATLLLILIMVGGQIDPGYWGLALLGFLAHPIAYRFLTSYRLWAEVTAYKVQMRYPDCNGVPMPAEIGAARLCETELYHFDLTWAEALGLLNS